MPKGSLQPRQRNMTPALHAAVPASQTLLQVSDREQRAKTPAQLNRIEVPFTLAGSAARRDSGLRDNQMLNLDGVKRQDLPGRVLFLFHPHIHAPATARTLSASAGRPAPTSQLTLGSASNHGTCSAGQNRTAPVAPAYASDLMFAAMRHIASARSRATCHVGACPPTIHVR
jgi:hypothetical protein